MRRFPLLLVLLTFVPAAADVADRQIEWIDDWDAAFKLAKESERPVMVCINSKDGEKANQSTANEIYHDAEFVGLTRKFVMVVISTLNHAPSGLCPRFGRVSCKQHLACWKQLSSRYGDQLATAFKQGEMVSPQHVWFRPDGTLIRRKEYWLDKAELMRRMTKVLDELAGKGDEPAGPTLQGKDAPLDAKDKAELRRVEEGEKEERRAAVANLLATEKTAAHVALLDVLRGAKGSVKCDVIRGLGRARVLTAREDIEACFDDKDELVRSFAAVALEDLGLEESVEILIKRTKSEKDTTARKNAARALGACGGPYANKAASKRLLKSLNSDKQNKIKKHAALALKSFGSTDEAKKLVVKKMETATLKTKDREVRGAIIYTLAFIGNEKTTLPIFKKILESVHEEYSKRYVREAMRILRGEASEFGRSAWWLFRDDRDDPARED